MTYFRNKRKLIDAIEEHNDLVRTINNMPRYNDEIRFWADKLNDGRHLYLDVQNRDGGVDSVDFTSTYKSLEKNILNSYKRLESYRQYQLQQLKLVDIKIETLELEVSTSPLAHWFKLGIYQLNNSFLYRGKEVVNI